MLAFLMTFVGDDPDDQERFRKLYYKYHKHMYIRAFHYTGDEQDSLDIVQEAFIKVARHFDQIGNLNSDETKHYLLTTVGNCAKDELERSSRRKESEEAALARWQSEAEASQEGSAHKAFELRELIKSLPENYKRPLYMYYVDDMSTAEIAELLETSPSAIRKRLERARAMLREMVGEDHV